MLLYQSIITIVFASVDAGDGCHHLAGIDLAFAKGDDVPPKTQHDDPVSYGEDVGEIVADNQDTNTLCTQPANQLKNLMSLCDAERGGRLIQLYELWLPNHTAGDGNGLALPTG